jgi:hypothetical protein
VIALTEAALESLQDGGGIGFQARDLGALMIDLDLQFGNDLLKSVARLFVRFELARLISNATKQHSISAAASNAVSPSTPALPFLRSRSARLKPMGKPNC